jgi:hypothetical protein
MMNLKNSIQGIRQVLGADHRHKTTTVEGPHEMGNGSEYVAEWGMVKNTKDRNSIVRNDEFTDSMAADENFHEYFY